MTMITANCPTTARAPACTPVTRRFSVFATLQRFHDVWRQRRTLKTLDAAALSDIGLTRAQAKTEASRPIWDAPSGWRH